jgi:hypothetical protein
MKAKRFVINTHREEVKLAKEVRRLIIIHQVVNGSAEVGQDCQKNELCQPHCFPTEGATITIKNENNSDSTLQWAI